MSSEQQLSDFKLKLGYWLVTHKIFIKRMFVFLLIVADALIVSFVTIRLINFYSHEAVRFEKNMYQLGIYNIDYASYRKKIAPQSIQIIELDSVPLAKNKYNFVAKVKNPNNGKVKWVADEIEYFFSYNGLKTETKKSFVLPGEEKFLCVFNIESKQNIFKPRLVILKTKWKRIKKGEEELFFKKLKDYLDFEIKNSKFLNAASLGLESKTPLSAVRFSIKNNTGYDYYEVGLFVVTYNGPIITSINYFLVNNFISGEEREIEIRWNNAIAPPNQIVVVPELNVLGENIVMRKSNSVGIPK